MTQSSCSDLTFPRGVIWDITYGCPLRCVHCYSESGRRPTRQLSVADLLRVTDALIAMRPATVAIAGGEPLTVAGLFDVAERFAAAGIAVSLYTSGWGLKPPMVDQIMSLFARVAVSLDGSTAEIHDRIRGRSGSFLRALEALGVLNAAAQLRRPNIHENRTLLGIEFVMMQSNIHEVEGLCRIAANMFPELDYINFGAAVPSGLASRPGFVAHELLADEQLKQLAAHEFIDHLRTLVPPSVSITINDMRALQYHPTYVAAGVIPDLQVEPDGQVRAMTIYEGTVGSLLFETPEVILKRVIARWGDSFVKNTLAPVETMEQWAVAARAIDEHFAADEDRARIRRRPDYRSRRDG